MGRHKQKSTVPKSPVKWFRTDDPFVFFSHENRMDPARTYRVIFAQLRQALPRFEGRKYLTISVGLIDHFDPVR